MKKQFEKEVKALKINSFKKIAELAIANKTSRNSSYDLIEEHYKSRGRLDLIEACNSTLFDLINKRIHEKHIKRKKDRFKNLAEKKVKLKSIRELEELELKASTILNSFDTGYKMGDEKSLKINGVPFKYIDQTLEYSRSSSFVAKHGDIQVDLSLAELRGIEKIEGVWTYRKRGNCCFWLEEYGTHSKFRIERKKGYLAGLSHGVTLEEAKKLDRLRKASSLRASKNENQSDFEGQKISVSLLKRAGACNVGINNALKSLGITREAEKRVTTKGAIIRLAHKKDLINLVNRWIKIA